MTYRIADVIAAIEHVTGVTKAELQSPNRYKYLTAIRQLTMLVCLRHTGKSTLQVGAYFHRDHTTVMNGRTRALALLRHDPGYRTLLRRIEARLVKGRRYEKGWQKMRYLPPPPSPPPPFVNGRAPILIETPRATRLPCIGAGEGCPDKAVIESSHAGERRCKRCRDTVWRENRGLDVAYNAEVF